MPRLKTYPNLTTLFKHAIFKERYKENKGYVYYFNNNVVIINYNSRNNNVFSEKNMVKNVYGIKVIHDYKLLIYTTQLTKEQFEVIYNLII